MKIKFVLRVFIMIIKELLIGMKEKELIDLLSRYKKKDGSYDVLIPGSGGKDSIFCCEHS